MQSYGDTFHTILTVPRGVAVGIENSTTLPSLTKNAILSNQHNSNATLLFIQSNRLIILHGACLFWEVLAAGLQRSHFTKRLREGQDCDLLQGLLKIGIKGSRAKVNWVVSP